MSRLQSLPTVWVDEICFPNLPPALKYLKKFVKLAKRYLLFETTTAIYITY